MRIVQYIARCGICSRRQAKIMLQNGSVFVNETRILHPWHHVNVKKDVVRIDNKLCTIKSLRIWRYYKPIQRITTRHDPQGRKTIYEDFPKNTPTHMIPIGRLDFMSEGLLLLTNDGYFARYMEHPTSYFSRTYRVWVNSELPKKIFSMVKKKFTIQGITYQPMHIKQESNTLLITITEGKNRQIRKIMKHFGCPVRRLLRLTHGPFTLGMLRPGDIKEIPKYEIDSYNLQSTTSLL